MERDGVVTWLWLAGGVLGTAAATTFVLLGHVKAGGWGALVASVGLTAASLTAQSDLARFLGAIAYRAFDGFVLSAIAWSAREANPSVSAAALIAMAAGFLAAYFAARGRALGYDIRASATERGLHTGLVGISLLAGAPQAWLWTVAILSVLTAVVRGSQAFKEERV